MEKSVKNEFRNQLQKISNDLYQKSRDMHCGLVERQSIEEYLEEIASWIDSSIDYFESDLVDVLAPKLRQLGRSNKLKGAEDLAETAEEVADWILL